MTTDTEYALNRAGAADISTHLTRCDADFVPPLSTRVTISDYAGKIARCATRFEAWDSGTLIGLVAAYCNNQDTGIAYITSVSVLPHCSARGIASHLLRQCIEHAKASGMQQLNLEVASNNLRAIRLYTKCGFTANAATAPFIRLTLCLKSGENHDQQT